MMLVRFWSGKCENSRKACFGHAQRESTFGRILVLTFFSHFHFSLYLKNLSRITFAPGTGPGPETPDPGLGPGPRPAGPGPVRTVLPTYLPYGNTLCLGVTKVIVKHLLQTCDCARVGAICYASWMWSECCHRAQFDLRDLVILRICSLLFNERVLNIAIWTSNATEACACIWVHTNAKRMHTNFITYHAVPMPTT